MGPASCPAAVAALSHAGASTGTLTVRVPGGDVVVTVTEATSYLRGPSVLVARGELSEQWWQEASALNRMRVGASPCTMSNCL